MNGFKKSTGDHIFDVVNHIIIILFTLACLYPFYYIIIYSLSDPNLVAKQGVTFTPAGFSLDIFQQILTLKGTYTAIIVSSGRTVIGTLFTLMCTSFLSYILTKPEMYLRKVIYRFIILTMYINAGLIPWYITMKTLGLKNNFLLYVLPFGIQAFYIILTKTFLEQLPTAIEESARVDGAHFMTVFTKIILPLSVPILATIAIFSAVSQWNSWQDNFYLVSDSKLNTLQFLLYNYLTQTEAATVANSLSVTSQISSAKAAVIPTSVKMTMSVITILPILIVYPLMQRFFVKGIMLGAVKG